MITVKTFCFNLLQENTYVLSDDTQECVIIDCGAYYQEERDALVNYINDNHLKPTHLLCTHGHFDHNFGINTVYDTWGLKPEIASDDDWLISYIPGQFLAMAGVKLKWTYPEPGHFFDNNEVISKVKCINPFPVSFLNISPLPLTLSLSRKGRGYRLI